MRQQAQMRLHQRLRLQRIPHAGRLAPVPTRVPTCGHRNPSSLEEPLDHRACGRRGLPGLEITTASSAALAGADGSARQYPCVQQLNANYHPAQQAQCALANLGVRQSE